MTLTPGSGPSDLWELVSELHGGRLDMSVPLWTSYLIDGLPDGRFALYIKIHHTVIDGVGGLRMISESLSTDPNRRSLQPFYADKGTGQPKPAGERRLRLPSPFAAVRAVADAGQRRREYLVTLLLQQVGDAPPAPAAMPGAVNEDERCLCH